MRLLRKPGFILATLLALTAAAGACSTGNELPDGASGTQPGTPAATSAPTPTIEAPVPTATATPNVPATVAGSPTLTPTSITLTVSPGTTPRPGASATVTRSPLAPSPVITPTPSPQPATPTPSRPPTPTALPAPQPLKTLGLERVFSWYSPARPTHLEEAADGSGRIFVSEQSGRLIELIGDPMSADGTSRTVLDIRERVTGRASEEGLLGFALHPELAENNRIFVYYSATGPRRSVISEFRFQPDGQIDPGSERTVLEVTQPQDNHNGGMLAFGPDGFLYISLGDGGGAGDQSNNAQNTANVLGSILRIDIDSPGLPYAVPQDNPFASGSGAPEIWAYGLRNTWRFSFDRATGELWAGDVGQNRIEEVDLIIRGGNYGWRLKEGPDCFNPSSNCDQPGLTEPVISYTHNFGCSISGGYVYRGTRLPSLFGAYIYADFCSGIIWGLRHADGELVEQLMLTDSTHQVPAFGQTLDGEVYVLTYSPGIFRFAEDQ